MYFLFLKQSRLMEPPQPYLSTFDFRYMSLKSNVIISENKSRLTTFNIHRPSYDRTTTVITWQFESPESDVRIISEFPVGHQWCWPGSHNIAVTPLCNAPPHAPWRGLYPSQELSIPIIHQFSRLPSSPTMTNGLFFPFDVFKRYIALRLISTFPKDTIKNT